MLQQKKTEQLRFREREREQIETKKTLTYFRQWLHRTTWKHDNQFA